jgi:hypothetical protein
MEGLKVITNKETKERKHQNGRRLIRFTHVYKLVLRISDDVMNAAILTNI